MTSYLDDIGDSGEYSAEFLSLYKRLIVVDQWKFYLAVKGVLLRIGVLMTRVSVYNLLPLNIARYG